MLRIQFLFLAFSLFASLAQASDLPMIRWTSSEDPDASIAHVIAVLKSKTNLNLTEQDFLLQEDRDLAFTHYSRYEQLSGGVPINGKSIRIWSDRTTNQTVQVEASLEAPTDLERLVKPKFTLSDAKTLKLVKAALKKLGGDDASIRGLEMKDRMVKGQLTRMVTVTGKRGKHKIQISHATQKVSAYEYQEFPQADTLEVQALVYPIYEEVEGVGTILPRQLVSLTHIHNQIPEVNGDIYSPLKSRRYFFDDYSTTLGSTPEGRAKGYWNMAYLKDQAAQIRVSLVQTENRFQKGLVLEGDYATINIHPDAYKTFYPIGFQARPSSAFFPNWIDTTINGVDVTEVVPGNAFYGKPLYSADEALNRPARRLPNHSPVEYLNDGFDEIQVYYGINTLMEELQKRGFTDPDLSTRPFNAFLYNPDIAYRDNAFYTDDTINFTTYSPDAGNAARDNGTIWHELGHGVMDRLMGDQLQLADTGGLSEGMADFVAAMVVRAVTNGTPFPGSDQFRIINQTGFFLTNEVHDDGEAYGGAMKDFLDAATSKYGQEGLSKVADLILEAMRLSRDHPALTAIEWFNHILFADSLGRAGVRAPGELSPLLLAAINGRNFRLDGGETASFRLMNDTTGKEVVAGAEGSRNKPIKLNIPKDATAHFDLSVNLKSSVDYSFQYPLTVKVAFEKSPLQGAVHWIGKEKGPLLITLQSESDAARIPLDISGTCDSINRQDGSCVDYVHVQILNPGETDHPRAKKRFYVQIKNP